MQFASTSRIAYGTLEPGQETNSIKVTFSLKVWCWCGYIFLTQIISRHVHLASFVLKNYMREEEKNVFAFFWLIPACQT